MDFEETEFERMIRSSVRDITESYDDEYWREMRESGRFPREFWDELAAGGWVGVAIPEEYGGQGLGMEEMVIVMEEVGLAGGWPATLEFVLTPVFGGETLVAHGSREQKERWLPKIASGEVRWALGVTEPDAGLNTPNIETVARKDGDDYVVSGEKTWISAAADAERITLLARTTPIEHVARPTLGMTVFLIDPADPNVTLDPIDTDGYFPDTTYTVYLDDVRVPSAAVVGEVDRGLQQIFDTLNTERMTIAASAVATGEWALEQACDYASKREVFDAPIGSHQALQHPLADAYAELACAKLMNRRAAWQYDNGEPAGSAANIAKLQCADAAWHASEAAMSTFGGMSIAREIGLAAAWSYVRHLRIAPVSEEMIRNYIAEHELGLPRSY